MIDRRRFLTASAAFGAALITLPRSFAFNADETVITILHTNDTHSQIDPLPPNDKNAGKGGVARRATLVKRVRKENPNTLLIDAGDVFKARRTSISTKAKSSTKRCRRSVTTWARSAITSLTTASKRSRRLEVCKLRHRLCELRRERHRARGPREALRREDRRRHPRGPVWIRDQSGRIDHACELQRRHVHRSGDGGARHGEDACARRSAARWWFACRISVIR